MPKDKLSDYSATNASNTDVGGVNIDEGMLPSAVNNALRELMTHLKEFADGTNGIDVLSLADDDASASIKIQAPSAVTTTTTLTLPDGAGSNGQALVTDGSGTLSWDTVSSVGGATGVDFDDNVKARFGTGNDLEIYHDGSNSYVKDAGTGHLILLAGDLRLTNAGNTKDYITATDGGDTQLFYDGVQKLATSSSGADIRGDLTLYAEGSNNLRVDVRQGVAKWWTTLEQNTTYTTYDSLNISSTSDDGTGKATVTFSNNMNNDDYCIPMGQSDGLGFNDLRSLNRDQTQAYSTSQFGFYGIHSNGTVDDYTRCWLAGMGDLA